MKSYLVLRPLTQRGVLHHILPLFFVVLFAVVGVGYLVYTHAATNPELKSVGLAGTCVDVVGGTQPNAKVALSTCNGSATQKVSVSGSGSTIRLLFAASTGSHCLEPKAGAKTAGTYVISNSVATCNTYAKSKTEYWKAVSGGYENVGASLCLTATANSPSTGLRLQKCAATALQKFTAATYTTPTSPAPAPTPPPSGGGGGGSTSSTGCAPAKSATMNNTVSHTCGFPDSTNTGPSGTLYAVGSGPTANTGHGWSVSGGGITVSAGGLLENVNTGGKLVTVKGANATVKNCKILSGDESGFGVSLSGATNAVIENNEIGDSASTGNLEAGIKDFESGNTYSGNTMIKANNVYRVSTGIQVDHGTIQDNYVHDLVGVSGEHINGTTSNGGADGQTLTISHNTVFNPNGQTDAISLFEDFGVQANRTINDNLMAGGGYTLYAGQNAGGPAVSNIKVTNNHFSKMYYTSYGYYGYHGTNEKYGSNGNVWSGNVDDATGKTLGP